MIKHYIRISTTLLFLFITSISHAQKAQDKAVEYDDRLLFGGCWFVPHNAGVNLRFSENSNFKFEDFDKDKGEVTFTGKYLLDGHNLWLLFNDKPKQKFYFYKGDGADDNYYLKGYPLKTTTYYFVHGECD